MSQTTYTNYRDAVRSFPLGYQQMGLLKPGRYNGYDIFETTGGLSISLNHSGQVRRTDSLNQADNAFGAILMPTGTIIHDTNEVLLNVLSNAGNANERKDLVICEHNYLEIQGGTQASYSIIQGPNTGDLPQLTNPEKQIIIGVITVEPNGNAFEAMSYVPETTPLPGDMGPAELFALIQSLINQQITNSGGEANTASNTGTGVGVFSQKVGVDLKMRTVKSPDSSIGITLGGEEEEEVHLVQLPKNNIVTVNESLTLQASHNGKILRFTNTLLATVTIPAGLPAGFEVMIFQDSEQPPINAGLFPFTSQEQPTLVFQLASGVKARSLNAYNALIGRGFNMYLTHISGDYFVLMGDLTTA